MRNLVEVSLRSVQENVNYLISVSVYDRHYDNETYLLMGNGKEIFEYIKDMVGFEDDEDEDLFTWFDENNGDGDDLISIFEL